jgi:hypothetical protein
LVVDSGQANYYHSHGVTTADNSGPVLADLTAIRRALDEVAQALTVIAPVTARLLDKLGHADEDAVALETSVKRAIRAIKQLQPVSSIR